MELMTKTEFKKNYRLKLTFDGYVMITTKDGLSLGRASSELILFLQEKTK